MFNPIKYSFPEFRKKLISLFKTPEITQGNIKELMCTQKRQDDAILEYDSDARQCPVGLSQACRCKSPRVGIVDFWARPMG